MKITSKLIFLKPFQTHEKLEGIHRAIHKNDSFTFILNKCKIFTIFWNTFLLIKKIIIISYVIQKKKLSGKIIYIYSFSSRGRKDFYNLYFDTYRLFILMQKKLRFYHRKSNSKIGGEVFSKTHFCFYFGVLFYEFWRLLIARHNWI